VPVHEIESIESLIELFELSNAAEYGSQHLAASTEIVDRVILSMQPSNIMSVYYVASIELIADVTCTPVYLSDTIRDAILTCAR